MYKQTFAAAVATAAVIAIAGSPSAQDTKKDAMKKLDQASGAEFDKAFMTQMVKDHEDALKLVQNTAKSAKDPALKADAEKTAPLIEKHLEMAKSIASALK